MGLESENVEEEALTFIPKLLLVEPRPTIKFVKFVEKEKQALEIWNFGALEVRGVGDFQSLVNALLAKAAIFSWKLLFLSLPFQSRQEL